uniref:Aryl hydrocarbon receptor 1b n=1 Tax=Myripristis murdjan TaxID=586833 RepID=A0A667WYI3_9TELE
MGSALFYTGRSAKSNPSKRHRDRLNSELERLAGLLPFPADVTSGLDKLSILRLSVSFLRTKSFLSAAMKDQPTNGVTASNGHHDDSEASGPLGGCVPEGELLLQALHGFVLVVTVDGLVFFCSHTVQDYLGFHQTDVMQQSVFELIHTDDQHQFRRNLHWAPDPPPSHTHTHTHTHRGDELTTSCLVTCDPERLPPENSSLLERNFVCRFRCLLDSSSGFLALNVQGRLRFLLGQRRRRRAGYDESDPPPQLALFAVATPLQPPAILEIRTRNMIFRTKHKLDFTPTACDAKGKVVLGYTEAELRVRGSGYQFIHAADMLYCAENHVRMIKTGESGLTVFRLLTKDNRWKWVQANARLVYKNGKPDYIIATQRPLMEKRKIHKFVLHREEEGGEHLSKRSMHLPFTFATGEALLYQTSHPIHGFPGSLQAKAKGSRAKKGRLDKRSTDDLHPNSLLGALMSQDESVYVCQPDAEPKKSHPLTCNPDPSLFPEPQGEGFHGLLGGEGWNMTCKRLSARSNNEKSSYDPLLATLDSLSLEGDETCSNSELLSALENLGLNAEDLEVLLLDERMIQVELDPDHVPTLSDLLTNNEIISYIHDSLESRTEVEEPGHGSGGPSPPTASSQSNTHQLLPCPTPPILATPLPNNRQLNQTSVVQMSQHVSTVHHEEAQPWLLPCKQQIPLGSQPETTKTEIHNSHWVAATETQRHHSDHTCHHHPQIGLKVAQLNGEHKHLSQLLESNQPWPLRQDQLLVQLESHQQLRQVGGKGDLVGADLLLPGYPDQINLMTNGPFIPNGHTAFTQTANINSTDYDIPNDVAMNGTAVPEVCNYQGPVAAMQQYQLLCHQKHRQQQQTQVPPSCLSQSAVQELEQLLALSQPQHNLPSLEAYSMFNTTITQDATHSKVRDTCQVPQAALIGSEFKVSMK